MVTDASMDMYMGDKFSRVNFNLGAISNSQTVVDLTNKKSLTLSSGMMGKTATEVNFADKKPDDEKKPEVELVDETKEIAGFACKKAIVINEDGAEMTVWYTDQIKFEHLEGTSFDKLPVPGFPLEYEMKKGAMSMKFTATKYEDNFKTDKKFYDMTIPEGYKIVSMDDLKKMREGANN
jgi:GLPGLI family protein